ncbi:response regulator [uncultured Algibacter sp.]|uniref:response regulator n=1 Tax=uncultured Algibacter sp. TaxID=298659 RepID=UPI00321772E0
MKTILLVCFLCVSTLSIAQNDKEIINKIDNINTKALQLYDNKEIVNALQLINESKKLSESINDTYGSALANFTQGQIYNAIQEYDAAESRFLASLKSSMEIKDNYLTANSYIHLGRLYKNTKSFEQLHAYYRNALHYAALQDVKNHSNQDASERLLFEAHIGLCQTFLENNLIEKGLTYLLRAETHLNNYESSKAAQSSLKYVEGLYFVKKELYSNASKKFNEALELIKDDNNLDIEASLLLIDIYEKLAFALEKQGLNSKAITALLQYNSYKNTFANEAYRNRKAVAKSKFLIEDYKKDAELANSERIEQLQITNKVKTLNIIISIALFLLLISLVTLYRSYMSKQKLTNTLKFQNRELELARNEALKSSELKSKFISNVTHELRTPLYGVVGITSLLLDKNHMGEKDNKLLSSLKYSGDYLLNLINDILQVSKIESQKIILKHTSVCIRPLIKNIVDSFEFKLKETNNKINVMIDEQLPEFILCDKVRLSQILINLIGNSIKFTESGYIHLRLIIDEIDSEYVNLRFEVEDTGRGIPQDNFDSIFDNFSQLDENNNINYQGTGLGLSITKNLIELFDSEIELRSEVGIGSMFAFIINFKIDKTAKSQSISDNSSKRKSSVKQYKILVAEDNKINQIVTQNLLKKADYACTVVANGLEALNEAKNNKYDLILMDINMPVMNGEDATKKIREFNSQIPIIALTASDVGSINMDSNETYFNDIIYKPFDNYEFYQVIETNIQLYKSKSSGSSNLVIAS